jgi:hypothetical protein
LLKIDGVYFTDAFANSTFLLFEVNTAVIDVGNQGDGLGKKDVDGFILGYFLIKHIRVFNRAVFDTGRTTRASVLDDVSGPSGYGDLKVSCFALYTVNFSMSENLYVWMPADLDQFG